MCWIREKVVENLQNEGIQGIFKHDIMEINDFVVIDCFFKDFFFHDMEFIYKYSVKTTCLEKARRFFTKKKKKKTYSVKWSLKFLILKI
jgi:hypothetical protein